MGKVKVALGLVWMVLNNFCQPTCWVAGEGTLSFLKLSEGDMKVKFEMGS